MKLWDVATRRPRADAGRARGRGPADRVLSRWSGRRVGRRDGPGPDLGHGHRASVVPSSKGPDAPPAAPRFAPDGRTLGLIAWGNDRPVEVGDGTAATGSRLPFPNPAADSPQPLAFSPDGGLYVSADGLKVEVRDAATGDLRSEFAVQRQEPRPAGFARRRDRLSDEPQDSSIVMYRQSGWDLEYRGSVRQQFGFCSKSSTSPAPMSRANS